MIIDFEFEANQPLTSADIEAFEGRIGKILPEDYKQHMLKWNGGRVRQLNLEHKNHPDDGDMSLSYFYAIDYDVTTIESLMGYLGDAMPKDFILIGSTNAAKVIMSLKDNDYGEISVMFSDGYIIDMSPSFSQFLEDYSEVDDDNY
ncbi:SMI1/KNR4 family protein [Polaribacter batillariae]|uniref:SMI1/KNR4 family protein n=1 Tax=Polaribacter batillariae TaxID=2808900 RepID=A0ABX7SY44_9FLAO|nr:SMI1/KNR4 family protein [Polaribacter batillariae]QTD39187.1 SMI1/KNR4 family protein [Polaribacter batillariae]